jgi:hypothetical protein
MQFERVLRALLMWQLIESQHIMQLLEKTRQKRRRGQLPLVKSVHLTLVQRRFAALALAAGKIDQREFADLQEGKRAGIRNESMP